MGLDEIVRLNNFNGKGKSPLQVVTAERDRLAQGIRKALTMADDVLESEVEIDQLEYFQLVGHLEEVLRKRSKKDD